MALFTSTLLAEVSGSLGGTVFSHNRGGKYVRSRTTPTDPNTSFQQTVRTNFATVVAAWPTLTLKQRETWTNYAREILLPDRLGRERSITGLQMFIRCNTIRLQAGLSIVSTGPIVQRLVQQSPVGVTGVASTEGLTVTFDEDDEWVDDDDGGLCVWNGPEQVPTVNYYKGPYRFAGIIAGSSTTPPTSPDTSLTSPFLLSAANNLFSRTVAIRGDGRISGVQFHGPSDIA